MDISTLHDATLRTIHVQWAEGILRIDVIYFSDGVRRNGTIIGRNVSGIECPRVFPWGESHSINEFAVARSDDQATLRIEMQSGDEISARAASFDFEEGEPMT